MWDAYQNCPVQYFVSQLCVMICTHTHTHTHYSDRCFKCRDKELLWCIIRLCL